MAKGKGTKGVVGEYTSTRGILKWGIGAAMTFYALNWLQTRAQDPSKKDSIPNKVAGALGFKGAGISA